MCFACMCVYVPCEHPLPTKARMLYYAQHSYTVEGSTVSYLILTKGLGITQGR